MHEYSVMRQLLTALEDELEKQGIDRVKEVELHIGELTFLGKEQLEFAYEVMTKDSFLEGSTLNVVIVNGEVRCDHCGYQGGIEYVDDPAFHYNIPIITCPKCGEKPKLIKGKETTIVGVRAFKED
ncbi:MAG: hydrogenase maturation nickel metallochaperone HypA [Thermoplasmata archaeon]